MLDSLRLIAEGRLRRIGGGWLIALAVYILRYISGLGVRFNRLRSQVTSRKLTLFLLASIVSLRLCSPNVLHVFFLMDSIFVGGRLNAARPSSL